MGPCFPCALCRRWSGGGPAPRNAPPAEDWPWVAAVRALDVEPMDPALPVELSAYLLLGNCKSASDLARLRELGVTHVLNVAGPAASNPSVDYAGAGIVHRSIDAEDDEQYPILARHLGEARGFVGAAREAGGRCLVHCVAGINRSGVVATAELMLHERLEVLEAVRRCRAARGRGCIGNRGFQEQLVALAREHGLLGLQPEGYEGLPPSPRPPKPKSASSALDRLAR